MITDLLEPRTLRRTTKSVLFLITILSVSTSAAKVQPTELVANQFEEGNDDSRALRADSVLKKWDSRVLPGVSVAIVKDGVGVYSGSYGRANVEHGIPISRQTAFDAASVAKVFTGYAIATLVDEGRLSLDEPVAKYLPIVPEIGDTPIRIRHLLHHSSGLRDFPEAFALGGYDLEDVITSRDVLAFVRRQRATNFTAGTQFLYSNTGYFLLAEIVREVTGISLPFGPLEMHSTVMLDRNDIIIPDKASPYFVEPDGSVRASADNLFVPGSSSLVTTTADLSKWLLFLDSLHTTDSRLIRQVVEPGKLDDGAPLSYAYGLRLDTYRGSSLVMHSGGWSGFRAYVGWYPKERLGIALLSNDGNFPRSAIVSKLADIFLENPLPKGVVSASLTEEKLDTRRIDPAVLARYAGTYEYMPGYEIVISVVDSHLVSTPWHEDEGDALIPTSGSRFQIEGRPTEISFQLGESGQATALVLHQRSRDAVAPRLNTNPSISLNADQLADYQGTYYSHELETAYRVIAEDGRLYARHFRNPDVWLWPTERPDRFVGREVPADSTGIPETQWWFQTAEFVRDSSDTVVGFEVSDLRIRNVRFDKMEFP